MQIYIYHDSDHGEIEVFESLEKAKQFTQEHWGPEQEWHECGNGKDGECDHWHDQFSDYVSIYRRVVPLLCTQPHKKPNRTKRPGSS